MEINLEVSEIINDDYSEFIDANSQIGINEESFNIGIQSYNITQNQQQNDITTGGTGSQAAPSQQIQIIQEQIDITQQSCIKDKEEDKKIEESQTINVLINQTQPIEHQKNTWQKISITKRRTNPQIITGNIDGSLGLQLTNNDNTKGLGSMSNNDFDNSKSLIGNMGGTGQQNMSQNSNSQIIMVPSSNKQNIAQKIMERNRINQQNQYQLHLPQGDINTHQAITFRIQDTSTPEKQSTFRKSSNANFQQIKERRQIENPTEPLPVFDCLFCCQEHFVLFKINENMLAKKYAKNYEYDWKYQLPILDLAIHCRLNSINQYLNKEQNKLKLQHQKSQEEQSFVIKDIKENLLELMQIFSNQKKQETYHKQSKERPQLTYFYQLKKQREELKKQAQAFQNKDVKPSTSAIQEKPKEELKQRAMNLQDIFGQDNSLDESQFCVNLRNRRQKVLQNISFESETHNIYDPYFTSEEELDSISGDSSSNSSNSCSQEDQSSGESQSEEDENQSEEDNYSSSNSSSSKHTVHEVHNKSKDAQDENSLSSIERQEDEDDFGSCEDDEEQQIPIIKNTRINNLILHSEDDEIPISPKPMKQNQRSSRNKQTIIQNEHKVSEDEIDDQQEEEDSERLTFGCVTPQGDEQVEGDDELEDDIHPIQDQQKVTFSNCNGAQSLSPVRQNMNQTHEGILINMSPNHHKNALLLDQSPLSFQDKINPISQITSQQNTQSYNPSYQFSGTTQQQHYSNSNNCAPGSRKIEFYPKQVLEQQKQDEVDSEIQHIQQRSYDTDSKIGNLLSQISRNHTEESKENDLEVEEGSLSLNQNPIDLENTVKESSKKNPSHSLFKQINLPSSSHSFTTTSGAYKHQKLLGGNNNHLDQHNNIPSKVLIHQIQQAQQKYHQLQLQQLQQLSQNQLKHINQDKISEMLKKTLLIQNKQLKQFNQQQFVSFDQLVMQGSNSQTHQNSHSKSPYNKNETVPAQHFDDLITLTYRGAVQNPQETLVSQRQMNSNSVQSKQKSQALLKNSADFTSGFDILKSKDRLILANALPGNQNAFSRSSQSKTPSASQHNNNNQISALQYSHKQNSKKNNSVSQVQKKKKSITHASATDLLCNSSDNPLRKFQHKGQTIKPNQREIENLRSALCSTRYSTTIQANGGGMLNNLLMFDTAQQDSIDGNNRKSNSKKQQKSKKTKNKRSSQKSSVQNTIEQDRKKESKILENKKKQQRTRSVSKNLHQSLGNGAINNSTLSNGVIMGPSYQVQNFMNTNKGNTKTQHQNSKEDLLTQGWKNIHQVSHQSSQQHIQKNSMYTSMQDNKNLFYPQAIQQTDTQNSYGIKNYQHQQQVTHNPKKKPRLNGSIEEIQNILSSIDFKQNPTIGNNQRTSASLQRVKYGERQGNSNEEQKVLNGKSNNRSISRQQADQITNKNPTSNIVCGSNGQFSFSQSSLKLNLTTNLSKIKGHKKKKSKMLSNGNINTTDSSSTLGTHSNNQFSAVAQQNRKKNKTRSQSKHVIQVASNVGNQNPATHQLLMTQQLGDQKIMIMKNQQILMNQQPKQQTPYLHDVGTKHPSIKSDQVKQKKTILLAEQSQDINNNRSQTRVASTKELILLDSSGKPQVIIPSSNSNNHYIQGKFLMSQVTSPLKSINLGNFSNTKQYNFGAGATASGHPHEPRLGQGGIMMNQHQQNSVSVKESIEIKKNLATELLGTYMNITNKNKQNQRQGGK